MEPANAEPPLRAAFDEQPNAPGETAAPALAAEPAFAPDPPPEAASETAQLVQEVTTKPENPRRGWWQRLIQS